MDRGKVQPSTSNSHGRRRSYLLQEESKAPVSVKRRRDTNHNPEQVMEEVKEIMEKLDGRLNGEGAFHAVLKDKIKHLEKEKRELVGVFGETGAGKSSLINAVIGEENLLPSGRFTACTAVTIKVEANMNNDKYEAEIELISKEDWEEELKYVSGNKEDEENDEDDHYCYIVEKLSAFYGEEWSDIPTENLMDKKYFKDIPEFLTSGTKSLTCKSVEDLSAKIVQYTKNKSQRKDCVEVKRLFWPLVKSVTVKIPNYNLPHVTIVDLPGSGDNNKSRDKMWTEIVKECSTVWIVAEITRAASKKEPWDILENASSLMGNGGECQQILFICTKSDLSLDDREDILESNSEAKEDVKIEFKKKKNIKNHFGEESLEVFTVSSKEFFRRNVLNPEDTEIPKLQEFLKNLNDSHSDTVIYVSGALGILSLIQGARSGAATDTKTKVCAELEENLKELDKIRKHAKETYEAFEKCLTRGVEESERCCEKVLTSFLYPKQQNGRGFHKILKTVVKNNGIYNPKKGKQININASLASRLTDCIDEKFNKTFPNNKKLEPLNGVIKKFSLGTDGLSGKYKCVELQLTFLKMEEAKIKAELNNIIRKRKKEIYNSLTGTIQDKLQKCYEEAESFHGPGTLENMRKTLEKHVCDSKNVMFKEAKDVMLKELKELMDYVPKKLEKSLMESIDLSLRKDDHKLPDVSSQLNRVTKYYNQLKGSKDQSEVDEMETEASNNRTSRSEQNPKRNISAENDVAPEKKLFNIRMKFVDRVSEANLNRLLDELLRNRVITDEEMQSTRNKTRANRAREVIDMVRKKGKNASNILISALCRVDPFLSKELNLIYKKQ